MSEVPLPRPEHLRPPDATRGWLAQRPAGALAAALGVISFIVVTVTQPELWATPDWRISVPGFAITATAAVASIARRERGGYWLWGIGVGLAGAALVLGWFLMFAIVIAATVIVILILHTIM